MKKTFKLYLEYMFAGTGYSTNIPDFIVENKTEPVASSKEKTFTSMIADISKIKENDIVAFYVTGCKKIFGFLKHTENHIIVKREKMIYHLMTN